MKISIRDTGLLAIASSTIGMGRIDHGSKIHRISVKCGCDFRRFIREISQNQVRFIGGHRFFPPGRILEPWNSRHGNRGRHLENGDGSMKKQRRIDVFEPVEAVGQTYDDVVHVNSSTRPCVDCTVVGSSPFSFLKTD
jgi:hypothetical protein